MAEPVNNKQEQLLEEAVHKFLDAQSRGLEPDIDEFVKQYPELGPQIRQRILNLRKIDTLFDSLVQADERDFDDPASGQDLVGQTIGSFEIVEIIGRGGMGVVYLARDTSLDRSVAIKSLPAGQAGDSRSHTRFRREAKLLASLNHSNIAIIHEIIEQVDGSAYLILEYIPGETLAQRMARAPLELEQALSIGQQIAEAVAAAHEKGVIHRDLKPGNIKITPEGKVKVLDFGLAKATVDKDSEKGITVTQPGRVMGTPAYMSPEQARARPTSHCTDIWSFGCVLYEMLAGRLPFEGETATDVLARIIEREPDWQALPQNTPANIRGLLQRCLEKDPQRRLQHIADAVLEIRETLNLPATAPPMTVAVKPQRMTTVIAAAVIVLLSGAAVWFGLIREAQPSIEVIRLMVLPFENEGSAEDEYFADGIANDIIDRLLNIHGLHVISAMPNKREQVAEQTAEEEDVDYFLQGTVKKEQPLDPNSKMRIALQLIKVSDHRIVWRDRYENNPIEAQSEIVKQVPRALEIALLKHEQRALAYLPTSNIEAYDFYLRGEGHFRRRAGRNLPMAIKMYDKAVKLDPGFALAYCRLSMCHSWMYWFAYDRSQKRLDMAKEAVETASEHGPDLPEVHQALGRYYYLGHRKYSMALEELYTALESQPHNSDVISFIGFIQRRQGKFVEALDTIEKASELQPYSSILVQEVADTLVELGRYEEAESCYDRAIRLAPRDSRVYFYKARLCLSWEGRTDKARQVLNEALQKIDAIKSTSSMTLALAELDVYERDYQGALDRLSSEPNDFRLRRAQIYEYMGKNKEAKELYGQARDFLESKIAEDPNDERFHSSLGIAYAGLGHNEEASREGELAVDLLPVTKDAVAGPDRINDLARIYVMVGKHDDAIDQLDFLSHLPGGVSKPLLRLDPAWDPLRDHPDFKKLVESGK